MLSQELTDTIASDEQFGFLLVRQKDYIIDLINKRKYKEARAALTVVLELWTICSYIYKYKELIERIKQVERITEDAND